MTPTINDRLGPEGIGQIMGMGGLQEQMATAQAMRDQKAPQGQTVRNGIYVGASPLEHLSTGIQRYKGKKDVKRIAGEQKAARTSVWDLLRERNPTPEYGAPT